MGGWADALLGSSNPFAQFSDNNSIFLASLGAGLGSGQNISAGLSNAAQAMPSGVQAQNAYNQVQYDRAIGQRTYGMQMAQRQASAQAMLSAGYSQQVADAVAAGADPAMFTKVNQVGEYGTQNDFAHGGAPGGATMPAPTDGSAPPPLPNGSPLPAPGFSTTTSGGVTPDVAGRAQAVADANATGAGIAKLRLAQPGAKSLIDEQAGTMASLLGDPTAQQGGWAKWGQYNSNSPNLGLIDKAILQAQDPNALGWKGQIGQKFDGSPAANLAQTLEAIKNSRALDSLQEFRQIAADSGAGSAIKITNKDVGLITNAGASIENSQSGPQLVENLQRYKVLMNTIHKNMGDSYNNIYAQYEKQPFSSVRAPGARPSPAAPVTPPSPVAMPAPTAPVAAAPVATATNPATGEKLMLQNGQWVPVPAQVR